MLRAMSRSQRVSALAFVAATFSGCGCYTGTPQPGFFDLPEGVPRTGGVSLSRKVDIAASGSSPAAVAASSSSPVVSGQGGPSSGL